MQSNRVVKIKIASRKDCVFGTQVKKKLITKYTKRFQIYYVSLIFQIRNRLDEQSRRLFRKLDLIVDHVNAVRNIIYPFICSLLDSGSSNTFVYIVTTSKITGPNSYLLQSLPTIMLWVLLLVFLYSLLIRNIIQTSLFTLNTILLPPKPMALP